MVVVHVGQNVTLVASVHLSECRHIFVTMITQGQYLIEISYHHQIVHLYSAAIRLWSPFVLVFVDEDKRFP